MASEDDLMSLNLLLDIIEHIERTLKTNKYVMSIHLDFKIQEIFPGRTVNLTNKSAIADLPGNISSILNSRCINFYILSDKKLIFS